MSSDYYIYSGSMMLVALGDPSDSPGPGLTIERMRPERGLNVGASVLAATDGGRRSPLRTVPPVSRFIRDCRLEVALTEHLH